MSFVFFNIGSALIVLGFTFRVIQITSRLTDLKSKEAGKKLRNVGIISIIAGLLIALIVSGMSANERRAMMVAGFDIAAIGVSTLIQYYLKPQNEKLLGLAAYGVVILGFLLCAAYEVVLYLTAS
jgi:hypothetical protein